MPEVASGVLKITKKGRGELRLPERSFKQNAQDVHVSAEMIEEYGLVQGAMVEGEAARGRRGMELASIATVCGLTPDEFKARRLYDGLVAVDPDERFNLSCSGNISMRIVDLVAPIGKGTRGLIVSPPKAGKTIILEQIAQAIRLDSPDTMIMVLLVDERPEEVTHFRRAVDAQVLASSSDQTVAEHVELAEITMDYARTELECGRDVVILVDSLTRMGRAFNLQGGGRGRIMSGGMEAGAMQIPRRFFGLARNIEGGGSVTIIATALIDTGSRMDQLIFEEFKGTGNSEIILDRTMAEQRIWPAIDLAQSGTRKEHKLYGEEDTRRVTKLRRALSDRRPADAMKQILRLLEKYPTNEEFLKSIPVGK